MGKYIYLILDPGGNVLAVYDDKTLAEKMVDVVGEKFMCKATVSERSINLSIDVIGIIK